MQEGVLMSLPDLICYILFVFHSAYAVFLVIYCILFCKELKESD